MMILAIDPGTQYLGYALRRLDGDLFTLHSYGVLTSKKDGYAARIEHLCSQLTYLINCHGGAISEAAIEHPHANPKNLQNSIKLSIATGAFFHVILAGNVPEAKICLYPPAEWKKAIIGNGNATKEKITEMVCRSHNLKSGTKQDAYDAIGISDYHIEKVWGATFSPPIVKSTLGYFEE